MGLRNFPDVYTTVTDKSFTSPTRSRFHCGLIGPAQNGPVNVATAINSVRDFRRVFGISLPGVFLSNAVQLVSDKSDGVVVVRIAHQYETLSTSGASATGTAAAIAVSTPNAAQFRANDYIRVSQIGRITTVNARVISTGSNTLDLDPSTPLQDTYTAATVDRSRVEPTEGDPTLAANAANEAEAFLLYPIWETAPVGTGDLAVVNVSGIKNAFEVTVNINPDEIFGSGLLAVGDVVKIVQTGLKTSRELMVKELVPPVPGVSGIIRFEPVNRSDVGYLAVSLQDSYTAASLYKLTSYSTTAGYHLLAKNPGTWANSNGVSTGLIANIVPGSNPDSKKLQVFVDSVLAEEIDNLSGDATVLDNNNATIANPNYIVTAVNGVSQYVVFALENPLDPTTIWLGPNGLELPANTRNAWQLTVTKVNVAAFSQGYNGENVVDSDYIGTVDPQTELPTGLKIFEDIDNNLQLDFIVAPGVTSMNVFQEMDRINRVVNMATVFDTPSGLNIRQANDWLNGVGQYVSRGKLDTYTMTSAWNWGTMTDAFTGESVVVPPTVGFLRCLAFTFDSFKPSFAAAGETRGLIPEFTALQYPRISNDAKQSTYRNGNVLNPIIINRNRIMLFGNQTTQRSNSKLASLNNVVTVNTILRAMYQRGRKYIFDPLDDILLAQMYQDFKNLLQGFKNDRFVEDFSLQLDKTNNSADDRNNRQANVDFSIIPIDALEKLFINATVRESGAVLNSVQ
jgi:hypothetical protein